MATDGHSNLERSCQRVNHIYRRFSTTEDRVDEVIGKVTMRTAVSARETPGGKAYFFVCKPLASASWSRCFPWHRPRNRLPVRVPVVSGVLSPAAGRLPDTRLGNTDDDAAKSAFAGAE